MAKLFFFVYKKIFSSLNSSLNKSHAVILIAQRGRSFASWQKKEKKGERKREMIFSKTDFGQRKRPAMRRVSLRRRLLKHVASGSWNLDLKCTYTSFPFDDDGFRDVTERVWIVDRYSRISSVNDIIDKRAENRRAIYLRPVLPFSSRCKKKTQLHHRVTTRERERERQRFSYVNCKEKILTTQLMPYLCPENSAICTALCGSEISQTRTFGMWPHSPVARSLPSPASAREVTVLRQPFNTCAWLFLRGLNNTTVQLQQRERILSIKSGDRPKLFFFFFSFSFHRLTIRQIFQTAINERLVVHLDRANRTRVIKLAIPRSCYVANVCFK